MGVGVGRAGCERGFARVETCSATLDRTIDTSPTAGVPAGLLAAACATRALLACSSFLAAMTCLFFSLWFMKSCKNEAILLWAPVLGGGNTT